MQTIENDFLTVEIDELGAQLHRIYAKNSKIDYLWDGNPAVWPKQAPNLFPSIGKTLNDHYLINGKSYEMPHHGFVADEIFTATQLAPNVVEFCVGANERTKTFFPFNFEFKIRYELAGKTLRLEQTVHNLSDDDFSFSLGAHPGFNAPIAGDGTFEDYTLTFDPAVETMAYHEIAFHDGFPYRTGKVIPLPDYTDKKIALNHPMFTKGLIILDQSNGLHGVTLSSKKSAHSVHVDFADFPQLCIWTKDIPQAQFICLESFYGMPDEYTQPVELLQKAGNCLLASHEMRTFNLKYTFD